MARDLRAWGVRKRNEGGHAALINSRATRITGNHTRTSTRLTHADNTALACQTYLSEGVNDKV